MSQPNDDVVARLVESFARRAILGYRGNLSAVLMAIAKGWIPNGDEPGVAAHLEALRGYLSATGVVEDDAFLLRYALTVPGQQRGIVPPLMVLDPNRNGFSERRKREAAGQVTRLREAIDLGRGFLPGLSSETVEALQQLAAIAANRPDFEPPPMLEQFRGLSTDQAREVASFALRSLESPTASVRELATKLLQNLACLRFEPPGSVICRSLRDKGVIQPACLYRDAGDVEAQGLLEMLDSADNSLKVNHLLLCLAWTRSSVALASFRDWAEKPPRWAAYLNVPSGDYTCDAGWSFNARGERVELSSPRCYRLRPTDADSPGVIACRVPIEQECPSCQSLLAVLFDFTGIEANLPRNAPRRVICCLYCSMFAPTLVAYQHDGSWEWIESATSPPRTDGLPWAARYLARESIECPPFALASVFEMDDATTIGGVPMWLQDADYPRCPRCAEWMRFLAQHDNSAFREEGLHSSFDCPECRILAVNYQQT